MLKEDEIDKIKVEHYTLLGLRFVLLHKQNSREDCLEQKKISNFVSICTNFAVNDRMLSIIETETVGDVKSNKINKFLLPTRSVMR